MSLNVLWCSCIELILPSFTPTYPSLFPSPFANSPPLFARRSKARPSQCRVVALEASAAAEAVAGDAAGAVVDVEAAHTTNQE